MKILLAALLLMSVAGSLYAQIDPCPPPPTSGISPDRPPQPEPTIAPQPGGWTVRPGRGVDINFGALPFPQPAPNEGFLTIQYVHTHNNPGLTCHWKRVDMIRITVLSYADPGGTIGERSDSFELPFNTDQSQSYSLDLNDRWIKKIDLYAHNSFGWSGPSNSYYSMPQYTGIRLAAVAAKSEGLEWRLCVVPME